MVSTINEGNADKKQLSDNAYQQIMLKNQKLEAKVKELEGVRKENSDIKAARNKQQAEFKVLYEDKQKLFEEIMALKEQVSHAKSETKEKIISIQFVEKEKAMLQNQLEQSKATNKDLDNLLSDAQGIKLSV